MREATPATGDLLLALETSGEVCSVAATRAGQFIAEHTFRHGMHLSERLLDHVDAVLHDADAALNDVTVFAVGLGPGSFTGTRIGVMTIKTLASVLAKPVYGIGSLDSLSADYAGLVKTVVAPMLPCRSGSVYTCPFRVDGTLPDPLADAAALSISELADLLKSLQTSRLIFCGPAVTRYRVELQAALEEATFSVSFGAALFPRASAVAHLAWERLNAGISPDDPIALVPLYISPPPITMPKQAF